MVILGNSKYNYDTATTTANKSMGLDLSATQSCLAFISGLGENISRPSFEWNCELQLVVLSIDNHKHVWLLQNVHNFYRFFRGLNGAQIKQKKEPLQEMALSPKPQRSANFLNDTKAKGWLYLKSNLTTILLCLVKVMQLQSSLWEF